MSHDTLSQHIHIFIRQMGTLYDIFLIHYHVIIICRNNFVLITLVFLTKCAYFLCNNNLTEMLLLFYLYYSCILIMQIHNVVVCDVEYMFTNNKRYGSDF